jgi:hypothetical protein
MPLLFAFSQKTDEEIYHIRCVPLGIIKWYLCKFAAGKEITKKPLWLLVKVFVFNLC